MLIIAVVVVVAVAKRRDFNTRCLRHVPRQPINQFNKRRPVIVLHLSLIILRRRRLPRHRGRHRVLNKLVASITPVRSKVLRIDECPGNF